MTETHLPVRPPHNRAMAATLQLHERLAAALRPASYGPCHYTDPIRGYSHAHHVMAIHAEHRCPRYSAAVQYAQEARP